MWELDVARLLSRRLRHLWNCRSDSVVRMLSRQFLLEGAIRRSWALDPDPGEYPKISIPNLPRQGLHWIRQNSSWSIQNRVQLAKVSDLRKIFSINHINQPFSSAESARWQDTSDFAYVPKHCWILLSWVACSLCLSWSKKKPRIRGVMSKAD